MCEFVMLVGISGSGKSSIAAGYKEKEYEVFSSDELREELYGDINDQTHNKELFEELYKRTRRALKDGKNVVLDATNLSSRRRKGFLNTIKHIECNKKCVVMAATVDELIRRDAARERTVGERIIWKQIKNFNMPHLSEGWNDIEIYRSLDCRDFDLTNFLVGETSHDCPPHHHETVEEHMFLAEGYAKKAKENYQIRKALLYHDVGKLFTKDFHDWRGNLSRTAHYYKHENVSAYLFLSSKQFKREDDWTALNLIQFHMEPYKREGLAFDRWAKDFDDSFLYDLRKVNLYDRIGRIKEDEDED